jgi:transcriptional regulator with XRE-family HTH domain
MASRRLKVELRQARKAAGRTQREVADAMEWSTAKLIRIEGGEAKISRNDLKALLEYYGITDPARVAEVHEIARTMREQESWSDYSDVTDAPARRFFAFESAAAVIRSYQPIVVPGQLQTAEYFDALVRELLLRPPEEVARRWHVRQRRQRMHTRDNPPTMHFVIDEAVVRRPVGGWAVMKRQLLTLQEYARQPYITIQIVPFAAGAHEGLNYRFVLLEFDDANEDDMLFLEEPAVGLRDDPEETGFYLERFFRLSEIALPPEDTIAFLDRVMAQAEADDRSSSPS